MAACCPDRLICRCLSDYTLNKMAQDTRYSFFDYADLDSGTCHQLQSILSATTKAGLELPWEYEEMAEDTGDVEEPVHENVIQEVMVAHTAIPIQPYMGHNDLIVADPHQAQVQLSAAGYPLPAAAAVCVPPTFYQPPPLPHMAMIPPGAMLPPHAYHRYPPPPPVMFQTAQGFYYMHAPHSHLPPPLTGPPPTHLPPPPMHGMDTVLLPVSTVPVPHVDGSIHYMTHPAAPAPLDNTAVDIPHTINMNADGLVRNTENNLVVTGNYSAQMYPEMPAHELNHADIDINAQHQSKPVVYSNDHMNETNNNVKVLENSIDVNMLPPVAEIKSNDFEKKLMLEDNLNTTDCHLNDDASNLSTSTSAEEVIDVSVDVGSNSGDKSTNATAASNQPEAVMVNGGTAVSPVPNAVIESSITPAFTSSSSDISASDKLATSTSSSSSIGAVNTTASMATSVVVTSISSPPVAAQAKPKVMSWASLLQNTQTANSAIVIQMSDTTAPSSVDRASHSSDNKAAPSIDANNMKDSNAFPEKHLHIDATTEQKARKELTENMKSYKLCHKSVSLQPRGLTNRTNWCYVNATLQALLACPPFYHLMKELSDFHQPLGNAGFWENNQMPVIKSMIEFVREFSTVYVRAVERQPALNSKGTVKQDIKCGAPFEPVFVYKMLQAIDYEAFKQGQQEDAEEFLSCILNRIHDELIAAVKKSEKQIESNGSSNKTASLSNGSHHNGLSNEAEVESSTAATTDETRWEQVKSKNRTVYNNVANDESSPISAIFRGQLCCLLHQLGQKESATLEPFFTLQLDIQNENVTSVEDALDQLVSKESLQGYTCTKSKIEVDATRRVLIEELPPVLVLHLKWFTYNKSGGLQKCMKQVDFDIDLELSKDLLTGSAKSKSSANHRKYKLFAAVSHIGARAVGGHYTADVFHPGYQCWIRCDDNNIFTVPASAVTKFSAPKVPYLIFYRRLDLS